LDHVDEIKTVIQLSCTRYIIRTSSKIQGLCVKTTTQKKI